MDSKCQAGAMPMPSIFQKLRIQRMATAIATARDASGSRRRSLVTMAALYRCAGMDGCVPMLCGGLRGVRDAYSNGR